MKNTDTLDRIEQTLDKVELWAMMLHAGPTIAGRPVAIRFKEPVTAGLDGSVTVRPDGTPDIRLSPGLSGDRLLDVYLHELAHARLHADQMPRSDLYDAPPKSRAFREYVERDHDQADEDQAEKLKNDWLRYGLNHADPGDQLGIIQALFDYYKGN